MADNLIEFRIACMQNHMYRSPGYFPHYAENDSKAAVGKLSDMPPCGKAFANTVLLPIHV